MNTISKHYWRNAVRRELDGTRDHKSQSRLVDELRTVKSYHPDDEVFTKSPETDNERLLDGIDRLKAAVSKMKGVK